MTVTELATAITLGLFANSLINQLINRIEDYYYTKKRKASLENLYSLILEDEKPVAKKTTKKSAKNVPLK